MGRPPKKSRFGKDLERRARAYAKAAMRDYRWKLFEYRTGKRKTRPDAPVIKVWMPD